jgi:hypothetical protein
VAYGSVEALTIPQAGRSILRFSMRLLDVCIDLIFPAELWPSVDPASDRNEYQKSFGVKGRSARKAVTAISEPLVQKIWEPRHLITLWTPTACYRDSFTFYKYMIFVPHRKHTYGPPRPITGIALFFYVDDVRTSQEAHLWTSTACYGDSVIILYVDNVLTSQEAHLWTSTACYGDSFILLYVDDVRTSQEAHLWTSTACYGDIFVLLYVDNVRTSQEAHLWTSTACYGDSFVLLYVDNVRTSQKAHLWTSTACYGDNFILLYVDDIRTSQETHLWTSTACYGDSFTLYICFFIFHITFSSQDGVLFSELCVNMSGNIKRIIHCPHCIVSSNSSSFMFSFP